MISVDFLCGNSQTCESLWSGCFFGGYMANNRATSPRQDPRMANECKRDLQMLSWGIHIISFHPLSMVCIEWIIMNNHLLDDG